MSPIEIIIAAIVVVTVILILMSFFTVDQQSAVIVQRFGKYKKTALPGLNMKVPFMDEIAGKLNFRVQQLDVEVETKTEDNVFIKLAVSVQYHILQDKVFEAFYKLENPEQQIRSFVFDVVRARVPKMKLDDVFEKKDDIAESVNEELSDIMSKLGYAIVKALVTDIDPDAKVKSAMNEINEAQRLRVAATERSEAEKILQVKKAEAEAQAAALQGKGMADQRSAIINGLKESVAGFQAAVPGTNENEILNLVLMTQYFDMIKELGGNAKNNTVLIPHSPTAVSDLSAQLRNAMITANEVASVKQPA